MKPSGKPWDGKHAKSIKAAKESNDNNGSKP
jgi:hypothetical protein